MIESRIFAQDSSSGVSSFPVRLLKHGALTLLGARQDELRHAALLSRTDLDKAPTNGAVVAAYTVGSVGAVDRGTVARALFRGLALRTNGAVGYSTKTADAGPAG
jgi:hypothetical protein